MPRIRFVKHSYRYRVGYTLLALVAAVLVTSSVHTFVYAQQSNADIRQKIEQRNEKIEALEKEIAEYQDRLRELSSQKQTLKTTIETLDVSRRKLAADISVTQERINTVQLEIQNLDSSIADKEQRIAQHRRTIASAVRTMDRIESRTLVETLLQEDTLADLWQRLQSLYQFNVQLQNALDELRETRTALQDDRAAARTKRGELVSLRDKIASQKNALDAARGEKAELLERTRNRESNFQDILAQKRDQKQQFQQELFQLESQLDNVSSSGVPSPGSGVLAWPVPDPSAESCWKGGGDAANCVTQFFGKTSASGRLYASGTHNGTDFRAAPGTPITAAGSGTVTATGNTDQYPGCYSYGKWVLIEHPNGLSTMYAHLSNIGVSAGASIATGELIGHSGNTGYSTGPHLHFTVYNSQGVQVVKLGDYKSVTNCPEAAIPVAPRDAYLSPLSYL